MKNDTNGCACESCPGTGCSCGCQTAKTNCHCNSGCQCGTACNCGPACNCKKS